MFKSVTALAAALVIGWTLVGSAADANAHHRRGHGCANCGPFPPSYTHKTKTVHKYITKYRDVHRTKYVKRIKPIIHVTRIQPVVHVHKVTRVHTRLVGVPYPVHRHVTQWLPPVKHVTSSVVYLRPQCGCAY
ncbi:MAG: hypothetical protein QOF14_4516 [Hyphomicrobiales bacterium]|jgi:hypothetical protein|nr:hypothetical protein [Hyphomicrobiales bacterium]